jgi:hypothetical protein
VCWGREAIKHTSVIALILDVFSSTDPADGKKLLLEVRVPLGAIIQLDLSLLDST